MSALVHLRPANINAPWGVSPSLADELEIKINSTATLSLLFLGVYLCQMGESN